MSYNIKKRGVVAVLTGGGDVPGLNQAIQAITIRSLREGFQVIGIRRGWKGLIALERDSPEASGTHYEYLTDQIVSGLGRSGGTYLRTSRMRPSHVPGHDVPEHLKEQYGEKINDLTPEVLKNLDYLGVRYLIVIGGDDTLSYAAHLAKKGVNIVAIPKTMDNDVSGTDYCIGFSTCITRIIEMTQSLRTTAVSHERILVIEVFGRYAGFTAMLPTMAGVANRCVIPEYKFRIEHLTELLVADRMTNPGNYSVVLVSEGAMFEGGEMVFMEEEKDMYGHKKLGGIGELVSMKIKEHSVSYNYNRPINVINQSLGYMVRCGVPDAVDSVVATAFGNLAVDHVLNNNVSRLIGIRDGKYGDESIETVTQFKKIIDVEKSYATDRLRPKYKSFHAKPFFMVSSKYVKSN